MRLLLLAASLASVIAACGEAPRSFTGKAERGTTAVLAVDEAGNNFRALPGSDGSFELPVNNLSDLSFYVLKSDGTSQSVIFQNPDGSGLTTIIPPSTGIVTFGNLSTDALDNLLADSSKNPLSQIDFANASGGTATAQSNGGGGGSGDHKTTICHSTNSAHNPFVKITVDNHALPAHRKHHHGRDIIPAPAEGCPAGDGSGGNGGGNGNGNGHGNGANGGGDDGGAAGGDGGEGEGEGATCPPNTEGCTPTGSTGGTDGSGSGTDGTGTGGTTSGSGSDGGTGGTTGGTTGTGGTGTGGEGEGEGEGSAPEIPPQG